MQEYSFEIVEQGRVQVPARILSLPDGRAIWGCVEAMALRAAGRDGAFIRVKNASGETIVRAGVSTALVAIESCPCSDCPLKRELRHMVAAGRHGLDQDFRPECALSGRDNRARRSTD